MQYEMLRTLSVPIPEPPHSADANTAVTMHLGREEITDEDDRCDRCGQCQQREKNTEVLTWPRLLVLHFKRLGAWDRQRNEPRAIDTHVAFENEFAPRQDIRYQLRAVIVHTRIGSGGHYTAYVRNFEGSWFYCDDACAPVLVPESQVFVAKAYMLFYER